MKHAELIALITQVRRTTRNSILLTICDECERMANELRTGSAKSAFGLSGAGGAGGVAAKGKSVKRDRAAYMREYRKRNKK